ncbi:MULTISPECIES: hypothetical protein [unclassified Streptomyces]|uniref:hypothetical protein n=1 Tax=unclassified Streptomyces TaxID=2593676 RepID=UPI00131B7B24|nr:MULTISPECIES: hypothetical protein [unclassified Streptomyces]
MSPNIHDCSRTPDRTDLSLGASVVRSPVPYDQVGVAEAPGETVGRAGADAEQVAEAFDVAGGLAFVQAAPGARMPVGQVDLHQYGDVVGGERGARGLEEAEDVEKAVTSVVCSAPWCRRPRT